jgi:hypothetical protein
VDGCKEKHGNADSGSSERSWCVSILMLEGIDRSTMNIKDKKDIEYKREKAKPSNKGKKDKVTTEDIAGWIGSSEEK